MILKNAKIYSDGLIHKGALFINNGIIHSVIFNPSEEDFKYIKKQNENEKEINCENKLILPGIIDIHAHLRDMGQSKKETFLTGTKAAAFSGITTIFNMPNTKPPAINVEQIEKWIKKAQTNIFINVGFIAGVPKDFNIEEIKKISKLGVIGFKIYPLSSLNGIDWKVPENIQILLNISSKFQIPIFIHPDWALSDVEKKNIYEDYKLKKYSVLKFHDKLFPVEMEAKYVRFIIDSYKKIIIDKNLTPKNYPIVHFCHISCIESYSAIKEIQNLNKDFKLSFEVSPHHLLLSKNITLKNDNFAKVLPPLRDEKHSRFLFNEFKEGNIELIGTDHAPHTLKEKSKDYFNAPSGFPGFETYPLLLLNKVFQYELSLENFVKVASENPAKKFNLKNKGFIKEGFDADLIIIDNVPQYQINPQNFKTKAKFSPYENFLTSVYIWKVFLRGAEINLDGSPPGGKIIKRMI
ncbi:MAG: dihydroorotase family protein [Promethearchaeota archaeon]